MRTPLEIELLIKSEQRLTDEQAQALEVATAAAKPLPDTTPEEIRNEVYLRPVLDKILSEKDKNAH